MFLFENFIIFALYIIISGGISNIFGYLIPRSSLNYDVFPYKPYKWEKEGTFYNKFHVTKWKKKVPDMSRILKLLYPKTLVYPPTASNIDRLLRESCVAEFIHTLLIAVSPLILRFIDGNWGIFYTACSIIGNIPYIIIQRYNRPKMRKLFASLLVKENKCASSEEIVNESVNIVM